MLLVKWCQLTCSTQGFCEHSIKKKNTVSVKLNQMGCYSPFQGKYDSGIDPVSLRSPALAGRLFTTSSTQQLAQWTMFKSLEVFLFMTFVITLLSFFLLISLPRQAFSSEILPTFEQSKVEPFASYILLLSYLIQFLKSKLYDYFIIF